MSEPKIMDGWTMLIADGHRDNIIVINPDGRTQFGGRLADMIEKFCEHEKLRYDLGKILGLSPFADLVDSVRKLKEERDDYAAAFDGADASPPAAVEMSDDSDFYAVMRLESWARDFGKDHRPEFVDDVKFVLRKLAGQRGRKCLFDYEYDENGEPIV